MVRKMGMTSRANFNGYLIHVQTVVTTSVDGLEVTKVTQHKFPVLNVYAATLKLGLVLTGYGVADVPEKRWPAVMQAWLAAFELASALEGNGIILPKATLIDTEIPFTEIRHEFWYEPFTAETRDNFEKAVGIQKPPVSSTKERRAQIAARAKQELDVDDIALSEKEILDMNSKQLRQLASQLGVKKTGVTDNELVQVFLKMMEDDEDSEGEG
jgi:hypothetical protein